MAQNRHWTVQLDVDSEGLVAAQVTANGRILLPALAGDLPEEALNYVEGALVDMQPGDTVEGAVHCPVATPQRYKVASPSIALLWLAETLLNATRITKLARGSRFQSPPATETRTKALLDPAADKKQHTR